MRLQFAVFLFLFALPATATAQAPPLPEVSRAAYDRWFDQVKNWGRWGANDSLGTLNLITPEIRRRAAASVRAGISVSLARDILHDSSLNDAEPMRYDLWNIPDSLATWYGERFSISFHGFNNSHLDWLPHTSYRDVVYGGLPRSIVQAGGAQHRGVEAAAAGIVTRGVLVDVPALKGVPYLEPGTAITVADLEAWERRTGIRIGPGDVLLVRTGRWARAAALGEWRVAGNGAGLHPGVAVWLHDRGVVAIGSDLVNDVMPSPVPGLFNPLHQLALVAMGMPCMDNLDFEAAAAEAARLNRWTFLFIAAPLRLKGFTGGPLNPLAVF